MAVAHGGGHPIGVGEGAGDQIGGAGLHIAVFLFPGTDHCVCHGNAQAGDQAGIGFEAAVLLGRHIHGDVEQLAIGAEGVRSVVGPEIGDLGLVRGAQLVLGHRRAGQATELAHLVELGRVGVEVDIRPALETVRSVGV